MITKTDTDRQKMITLWIIQTFFSFVYSQRYVSRYAPAIEWLHDPERYTTEISPYIFGTHDRVPYYYESPDFRVEEPLYLPYRQSGYIESNRPYRLTPHYKITKRWDSKEKIYTASCYCTTVYKRLTLLAGCAVITTRHVLTTATSTHLILKDRLHLDYLENILGAWYDTNHNTYNSTMYLSPARIHYHPLWHYPEDVNRSHPFSFTFDLAVWATTHQIYGWYLNSASAYVCLRATSYSSEQAPPRPTNEVFIIIGYQMMYAYRRRPMPWYKYGIRTRDTVYPCPKIEWGWFLCTYGNYLKYGIESGAPLHRTFRGWAWRYDGLIALGAFTMKLRYEQLVHYFTILDNHKVLDFLYDSYRSNIEAIWKDKRFNHKTEYAPIAQYSVPNYLKVGHQHYFTPYYD